MTIQITPWVFVSFHPRSLAGGQRGGRWFDHQIRIEGSPAARFRVGKTERRPRRTLGWLGSSRGGPELWRRRRAAAVGARLRRRGGSSGDWARRSGRLGSWRRGKANGGVGAGGEGLERWFRGGVELTDVRARRRRCSGAWKRGKRREREGNRMRNLPWC